jgi:LysM repeat protein
MRRNVSAEKHIRVNSVAANNQRTLVQEKRIVLAVTIFACVSIVLLIGFLLSGAVKTEAASATPSYKYYTSIQVEQGDTLWNIANTYMTAEYHDINEYIDEVCSINHISKEDIHTGQYLTIPYYSNDYLE